MSKIVLVAKSFNTPFLAAIRSSTTKPLAELQIALKTRQPFVIEQLFLNDHVAVDKRLREIVHAAEEHGVPIEVFELEPTEDFAFCEPDVCRIDVATLLNILDQADGKFG